MGPSQQTNIRSVIHSGTSYYTDYVTQIVPVRMDATLLADIDRRAAIEATSRSSVIRAALQAYLAGTPRGVLKISADSLRRIAGIVHRYGLASLEVFGSVAAGTATPASDVDLLYELRPGRRLGWEIEDLTAELAEVFGRPVDLVARTALHPRLKDAVLNQAQAIYAT